MFLNIVNKKNFTKEKLLKRIRKFDCLLMGIFIYNDKHELVDYFYNYELMNEVVLNAQKNYIFFNFLNIKINKINHKLRRDRHFLRG